MLKRTGIAVIAVALMTAGTALAAVVSLSAQDAAAPHITNAVSDSRRPAEDVERDGLRKPADMLAFGEVQPGQRIADIRPEEGYFTRLFAPAVGETGRVYAFVPTRTATRETPLAEALAASFANVTPLTGALDSMSFPEPLDAVFMVQEYHDFHISGFNTDVGRMNRAVFDALKPGGVYVVIDHSGRSGTGATEVQTLHRIEGDFLKAEVEAAGFVFEAQSDVLRNPDDDRTINVFDEAIRGLTDQFVYRFRKPE